ncbi:MAG: hypothetical protein RI900_1005 [Actinomycetota bacterium]
MEVRAANEGDLAGIASARLSNGPAHDDSGANPDYCRYLIDSGRLVVAAERGTVVGFAGAVDIGGARLLSDLYVRSDAHGRGVGSALLEAVLEGSSKRYTFASNDPATIPLYSRAGMLCRWPLLTLEGAALSLPATAAIADPCDARFAAAVEYDITGVDRTADHVYWAARTSSRSVVVQVGDRPIAAGSVRNTIDGCRVEHLAVIAGAEVEAMSAIVAAVGAARVQAYVPGCHELSAALLAVGFRVVDTALHMSSEADVVAPTACVLHPGLG